MCTYLRGCKYVIMLLLGPSQKSLLAFWTPLTRLVGALLVVLKNQMQTSLELYTSYHPPSVLAKRSKRHQQGIYVYCRQSAHAPACMGFTKTLPWQNPISSCKDVSDFLPVSCVSNPRGTTTIETAEPRPEDDDGILCSLTRLCPHLLN